MWPCWPWLPWLGQGLGVPTQPQGDGDREVARTRHCPRFPLGTVSEPAGTQYPPRGDWDLASPLGNSTALAPQPCGPPRRGSPVPRSYCLTCCGVWALPELACLLAWWVSWGCSCRLLFKPQIPGAGQQSRQRRGRREGTQSPGPCSRGWHQQKATVSRVLPVHPATRPAARGQPLGTSGLPRVPPPPPPALGRRETRGRALGPQSQPWSIPTSPRTRPCPLGPVPVWRSARVKALVAVPPPHLLLQSRPRGAGGGGRGHGCRRSAHAQGTHPVGLPEPCPAGAVGPGDCLQSIPVVRRPGAARAASLTRGKCVTSSRPGRGS